MKAFFCEDSRSSVKEQSAERGKSGKAIEKNQKWFSRGDSSQSVCYPVGR